MPLGYVNKNIESVFKKSIFQAMEAVTWQTIMSLHLKLIARRLHLTDFGGWVQF